MDGLWGTVLEDVHFEPSQWSRPCRRASGAAVPKVRSFLKTTFCSGSLRLCYGATLWRWKKRVFCSRLSRGSELCFWDLSRSLSPAARLNNSLCNKKVKAECLSPHILLQAVPSNSTFEKTRCQKMEMAISPTSQR